MKDSALFIGWGGTYPGREHHAQKTFAEFVEALTKLESKGEIEGFETILLSSVVGPLDGFVLVHGEPQKLTAMLEQEPFEQIRLKARLDNAYVVVIPAVTGSRAAEMMARWDDLVTEIERELIPA